MRYLNSLQPNSDNQNQPEADQNSRQITIWDRPDPNQVTFEECFGDCLPATSSQFIPSGPEFYLGSIFLQATKNKNSHAKIRPDRADFDTCKALNNVYLVITLAVEH